MSAQKEVLTLEKRLVPLGFNQLPASALTGSITAATKANPAVITSNSHGLTAGQRVKITSVVGMTELNNNTYTVANPTTNTFELLGINSTAFTTYVSGGTWTLAATGLGAGLGATLAAIPTGATYALLQAEAQAVRWRDDGVDPTTTVGMLLAAGGMQWLRNTDLSAVKILRAAAAGIINIAFYKEQDPV
jgi:hypothetical protein